MYICMYAAPQFVHVRQHNFFIVIFMEKDQIQPQIITIFIKMTSMSYFLELLRMH